MSSVYLAVRILLPVMLLSAGRGVASGAESAEGKFYHAYYLEHARGDVAKASELYEDVAEARGVDGWMADSARAIRFSSCCPVWGFSRKKELFRRRRATEWRSALRSLRR